MILIEAADGFLTIHKARKNWTCFIPNAPGKDCIVTLWLRVKNIVRIRILYTINQKLDSKCNCFCSKMGNTLKKRLSSFYKLDSQIEIQEAAVRRGVGAKTGCRPNTKLDLCLRYPKTQLRIEPDVVIPGQPVGRVELAVR